MKKLIILSLLVFAGCSDSDANKLPKDLQERQELAKLTEKPDVSYEILRKRKASSAAKARREYLRRVEAEKKIKEEAKRKAYNEYLDYVKKLWEQNPNSTKHTIGKYGLKLPVPVKEEKAEYKSTEEILASRKTSKPPEFSDGTALARWKAWKAWHDKNFPRAKVDNSKYQRELDELDEWYDEERAGDLNDYDRSITDRLYESEKRKIDHRYGKNLGRILPDIDY